MRVRKCFFLSLSKSVSTVLVHESNLLFRTGRKTCPTLADDCIRMESNAAEVQVM